MEARVLGAREDSDEPQAKLRGRVMVGGKREPERKGELSRQGEPGDRRRPRSRSALSHRSLKGTTWALLLTEYFLQNDQ